MKLRAAIVLELMNPEWIATCDVWSVVAVAAMLDANRQVTYEEYKALGDLTKQQARLMLHVLDDAAIDRLYQERAVRKAEQCPTK